MPHQPSSPARLQIEFQRLPGAPALVNHRDQSHTKYISRSFDYTLVGGATPHNHP